MRSIPHPAAPATPARGDRSYSWLLSVCVWALIVIMVVPDGFDYQMLVDGKTPSSGSIFTQITWLALLASGALMVSGRVPLARRLLSTSNVWLLAFCLLAGLSILWSIDSGITMKRVFRLLIMMLLALSMAVRAWRPTTLQSTLRPVVTALLFGSIVFVMQAPKLAIEQLNQSELIGAWRGLTTQKNMLGSLASLGCLLWLHGWLSGQVRKPLAALGLVISLYCLVRSRSSTSLMATAFASVLMLMLMKSAPALRRYMPYLIGSFAALLLLYSLAVLHLIPGLDFVLKPVTMLTGKDLTFSGRTAIWDIINTHIALNPVLGCGYGAYWVGSIPGTASYEMVQRLYFYPTEAHNGYLDVINDLGAVGGICLIGYLLTYLKQGLQLLKSDRAQAALYLVLLFDQLIANLSESMWLSVRNVEFVVMTLATACLARSILEARRVTPAAPAQAPAAAPHAAFSRWSELRRHR